MAQTPAAAKAVSGRAIGVLFFAGFGSLWMANGLAAMHRLNPVSLAAVAASAAAVVVPAIRLLRLASGSAVDNPAPSHADVARERETSRAFRRINAIQWIAILAAIVLLNAIHKVEYLAPVITFIVGMHLFPLATLFRYPAHNVTGTLLVVWAIANTATLSPRSMPSIVAIGTATILLGSAAYTIWSALRAARAGLSSPLSHQAA